MDDLATFDVTTTAIENGQWKNEIGLKEGNISPELSWDAQEDWEIDAEEQAAAWEEGREAAAAEIAAAQEEMQEQAAPQEETWVCNAQLSEPSGYAGETVRITLAQNDTIRTVFEGRTTFPYVLRVEGEPGVSEGMAYVYVLDDNGNVKTTTSYKGIVFQKQ